MCGFHFLWGWAAVARGSDHWGHGCCGASARAGEGQDVVRPGWFCQVDGEGQVWLSCVSGFHTTWILLWTQAGEWVGCWESKRAVWSALQRDKCLLSSVAVLPPGSNKVQQSPCVSTKQKMENVGKKARFLGLRPLLLSRVCPVLNQFLCPFLLSRVCGAQNQFQGHIGLATAGAKADQRSQPLAACQRAAALPEDLLLWLLEFLELLQGSCLQCGTRTGLQEGFCHFLSPGAAGQYSSARARMFS